MCEPPQNYNTHATTGDETELPFDGAERDTRVQSLVNEHYSSQGDEAFAYGLQSVKQPEEGDRIMVEYNAEPIVVAARGLVAVQVSLTRWPNDSPTDRLLYVEWIEFADNYDQQYATARADAYAAVALYNSVYAPRMDAVAKAQWDIVLAAARRRRMIRRKVRAQRRNTEQAAAHALVLEARRVQHMTRLGLPLTLFMISGAD